ncbi:DNA-binding protein [Herbaspirillum sp. DW155]|uniref:DNA-binding protein n=1 Tax=Herbaspirillum sp. DW155 TaxID=3095609 RepID=UPI003090F6AA|nr:DNA-binding protein [Herbaspirillum sp. DW155]
MARAGILYSQVAKAAAQLTQAGKTPTIDTVREALGDTGSKSTIAPMLKRWKAEHQESVDGADTGLPAELVEAIKSIYQRLRDDVARQLEEMTVTHHADLTAMREQRDAALASETQLRQAHSTLAAECSRAQQSLSKCHEELQSGALALTAAQTENAGLQQRLADRATEVHALNQQLTQARAQFEHFQEATARQRAEERQAFEQRLGRLEQEIAAGHRRHEAQQALLGQQEASLAHQAAELDRLRKGLAHAQNELHQVISERDQKNLQLQDLGVTKADAERRLDTVQQALIEARTEAATARKQVEMLGNLLVTAERKAEQAERDKAAWVDKILMQREIQGQERPVTE